MPLFFQWSKDGQIIKPNPDSNYKIDNFDRFSTFAIAKIDRKDAANYTCIVRNAFGYDSQNVLLTVKGMIDFGSEFQSNTKLVFSPSFLDKRTKRY